MRFRRVDSHPSDDAGKRICFLVNDNWDDFSFKTSFSSVLFDADGNKHILGGVKILKRGLKAGRVPLEERFTELDEDWCSLGNSREYYITLSKIDEQTREEYLTAIRDCVADPQIWQAFRDEEGMAISLLRDVSTRDVETNFRRILNGDATLTAYEFAFEFKASAKAAAISCDFSVEPSSKPPSNVHVLIGKNGVGKTRLLAGMADALTNNNSGPYALSGEFAFNDLTPYEQNEFLNLVVVSYSAFDQFNPIFRTRREAKKTIPYYYIGIKKKAEPPENETSPDAAFILKTSSDFNNEFSSCMETIRQRDSVRGGGGYKFARWQHALSILRSDPGLQAFAGSFEEGVETQSEQTARFSLLSSGHKVVLLTVAKLVEYVSDRSLVLIDEPETHLHPPLLGSFIRAVSELLTSQNAVAIVATHSPVVLQEVPKSCVSIVTKSGSRMSVNRPDIETFAENVSVLTRKIFDLEVIDSGFYRLLKEASQGRDFDTVIEEFSDQIGAEGRALARAFTIKDEDE